MRLGYNTNGFPFHQLEDALTILTDFGYENVALTLDHHTLNPFSTRTVSEVARTRRLLERLGLRCAIETGARFLLDPWRRHQPTLLSQPSEERGRRLDLLRRAVDIARELNSECVSFWSGAPLSSDPPEVLMQRLVDGCRHLADYSAKQGIRLAFEPEPGMFIDTLAAFRLLHEKVAHPSFGLTIDIGHIHCMGETPIADRILEWSPVIWNVHIEDMRKGVHDHLMFGAGEIEFSSVLQALREVGYEGGVNVELSRHGHDAVEAARQAKAFLSGIWPK